ncbi:MAG: hypothetical protein ACREEL_08215 [Stellaceae bacterium]
MLDAARHQHEAKRQPFENDREHREYDAFAENADCKRQVELRGCRDAGGGEGDDRRYENWIKTIPVADRHDDEGEMCMRPGSSGCGRRFNPF